MSCLNLSETELIGLTRVQITVEMIKNNSIPKTISSECVLHSNHFVYTLNIADNPPNK